MARVSVIVPAFRDAELLRRTLPLFAALEPRGDVEVVVVNCDAAQSLDDLAGERVRVLELGENRGYSGGANAGIRATSGELVLVANSDLFVTPGYARELAALLERRPRAAAASGKILRYDAAADRPLGILDTAGLAVGRNRRAVDRGEGLPDDGSFDEETEVFAASGAGLLLRREALEDVAVDGECFDEDFFMYREDLDLGWRLRLRGWECWYVPTAVAHHARTTRGLGAKRYRSALREFVRHERTKPQAARVHALKNQWLLLLKDDDARNVLRDLPWIAAREALVLGYNAVFAPRTLVAVPRFLRAAGGIRRKRRELMPRRAVRPAEIGRWFRSAG